MVYKPNMNPGQASEQRYRHLFEILPICIFVSDLTVTPVTILEVNQRAELVYGYKAVELVGKPVQQLVPEDARKAVLNIMQRVKQGETVRAEITNQRRDGTTFVAQVISTLDQTNIGRMITAVQDITAEKQRRSEEDAIAAERLRIAHEIHDGVAQSLAGLRFKSALWQYRSDAAPPSMRTALDEMQAVLNHAISDLRRAIFALRPLDLDALGFFPALRQFIVDFDDQYQPVARLEVIGQEDALPVPYELPLFRIIQEGLNNAGQHAQASSVSVHLAVDEAGGVTASVRDNGCGFVTGQLAHAGHAVHFGLRQMRERILGLGGTLDVRSAKNQGTDLLITLPPFANEDSHAAC